MKIVIAKSAGFCFGVKRALNVVRSFLDSGEKVCTLGPLIHNTQVIDKLKAEGLRVLENLDDIQDGEILVIRSHGVGTDILNELKNKRIKFFDATCPFVEKIHKIAENSSKKGDYVLILGDKNHPEVNGIMGHCIHKDKTFVFKDEEELKNLLAQQIPSKSALTVVSQTTADTKKWNNAVELIKKVCTNASIFDTICSATLKRQSETLKLAKSSNCMIVIGSKRSSNTKKLSNISERYCKTYLVETKEELLDSVDDLIKFKNVGIAAGASTPADIIEEVVRFMDEITNNTEELSFEEMLEESLKNMSTDEKVHGTVVSVFPNEIYVDVGRKQAGVVPFSELTCNPNAKMEDIVKVGDEIDLLIMKTNDMEGTMLLSKRRLDALKGWDDIEKAYEDKSIVGGKIVKAIKGGVLAVCSGVRVFIPASQLGLGKVEDLSTLVNRDIKFKIIEINRQKRRVVASAKAAVSDDRKKESETFWKDAEVGKEYEGTVRSITDYGVFIDLGGIDGMVHISELSWGKVKHPSDIVSIGDKIKVKIKGLDEENGRISLTCKSDENSPWKVIEADYHIGDVVKCKIVSMAQYGAFANIIPGVDGLIHISQISDKRIEKPQDALTMGQQVEAKILDIDLENKRISLSIKELIENPSCDVEPDAEVSEEAQVN